MELSLRNTQGDVVGSISVRDDVFGVPINQSLVHQVMVGQLANARQGTASVKTRGQVSGGGRKPRPQKHTGMSRVGSTRVPHWRGGGVAFGPHPRSYSHRTPKKMRRLSLVSALSDKVRHDELIVLDALTLDLPVTREMVRVLDTLEAGPSVLLAVDGADASVLRSARNIPRVKMIPSSLLNTLDVLKHQKIIMTVDAVRKAEELWGGALSRRKKLPATAAVQA